MVGEVNTVAPNFQSICRVTCELATGIRRDSCYKNKLHNCQYCWPILESHKKRKFVEDRIGFGFRYFERGQGK